MSSCSYRKELRIIASDWRYIDDALKRQMERKAICLCEQVDRNQTEEESNNSDGTTKFIRKLDVAKNIIIADDMVAHEIFSDLVYVAPQEATLEGVFNS